MLCLGKRRVWAPVPWEAVTGPLAHWVSQELGDKAGGKSYLLVLAMSAQPSGRVRWPRNQAGTQPEQLPRLSSALLLPVPRTSTKHFPLQRRQEGAILSIPWTVPDLLEPAVPTCNASPAVAGAPLANGSLQGSCTPPQMAARRA